MYAEITGISYDKKTSVITMKGTDVESILLKDWADEMEEAQELEFSFDLSQKGSRIYLFKICRSNCKEPAKSMLEQVMQLKGKFINISSNFIKKAED